MADPMTQTDITPKSVNIEDYLPSDKSLQALKANLGAAVPVPTQAEIKSKIGDITSPISSFEDYSNRQSAIMKAQSDILAADTDARNRVAALEAQQSAEQKLIDAKKKQYAAAKVEEVRKGQEQILNELERENKRELHFTQENVISLATLFSLLGVVTIGAGKGTRLSAMNAMNNMSGMMKGWREGRADLWNREKVEFEKNMAQIKNKLSMYAQKAELAWKTMPYDIEKAESMMQELVATTGSQIVQEKARLQGIPATAEYLKQMSSGFDKQFDKFLKQQTEAREARREERAKEALAETKRHNQKVEAHQNRMENKADYQYFVTEDNQVLYINKRNPKDTGIVADMQGNVRKLGAPIPTEKMPKKGETAAKFVSDVIGRKVDVSAAEKLTGTVDYVNKLDNLAKKNVSLGNVAGLSVNLADKVNSLLKSSIPVDASGQQIITQEALDNAWQKAQESKDFTSLSDKSKVMAKAELDTIMSYLQSKYGNRAPVAEFRAAQNVISRRSASPTAFNQVMKEEKEAAYKRLIGAGFTADDIAKVNKKFKEEEGRMRSLDSPSSTSNVPEGVDPETWNHMTDAEKALWQN